MRHAIAVVLGAFLLFQVQPLAGKFLLPRFGGTPAVWTTCMLFFQVLLVAGYGYGHLLATKLAPRRQVAVHLAVLAAAVLGLAAGALAWERPLLPSWSPAAEAGPVLGIVATLGLGVGLPYLVLSTTGPLLQAWVAREAVARSPYRLYALGNAGSLLGLLAYPLAVEPALDLPGQAWLFAASFAAFAAAVVTCALPAARLPPAPPSPAERPALGRLAGWTVTAAAASVLLLAETNELSQDVAPIPFLWVVPLAIYLLSFVLTFEREGLYRRAIFLPAFFALAAASSWVLEQRVYASASAQVGIHLSTLAAACMVCHGELARAKPAPRYLTAFYLSLAVGGALGGLFVALAAPRVFTGYFELHLGLALVAGIATVVVLRADGLPHPRALRGAAVAAFFALVVALRLQAGDVPEGQVEAMRGFYGVLRVLEPASTPPDPAVRKLEHGRIIHGFQLLEPERRLTPTTYYATGSGAELAWSCHPARGVRPMRLGLVGLGVGTVATYAAPGDSLRVYEINPQVVALAAGPDARFRCGAAATGSVPLGRGDARTSLEAELAAGAPNGFDVLVLDAFSSDAIPVHLLTAEAFRVYDAHLGPQGILAVHISNRRLDLRPVVWGAADLLGRATAYVETDGAGPTTYGTTYILLAKDPSVLAHPRLAAAASVRVGKPLLWTDQRSDLLRVMHWE